MPRSPGFGSNTSNSGALFRLAFAAPTPIGLSLLDTLSHRPIMQEVRCQAIKALQLLVGNPFQVLFHSPHRGAFHLSLTVLFRYRWQRVFSLRRWSSLIPTRFLVPRGTWVLVHTVIAFRLRVSHPLWIAFPNDSTIR